MRPPFIDSDVLVRYLIGDDPAKQVSADPLPQRVEAGELALMAPDTVIADVIFVLSSPRLDHLPRAVAAAMLKQLVALPGLRISNRGVVLEALDVFVRTNLDFGVAMIVASMRFAGANTLYSYHQGFDRVAGLVRQEP